jgi:hypothetical protein
MCWRAVIKGERINGFDHTEASLARETCLDLRVPRRVCVTVTQRALAPLGRVSPQTESRRPLFFKGQRHVPLFDFAASLRAALSRPRPLLGGNGGLLAILYQ